MRRVLMTTLAWLCAAMTGCPALCPAQTPTGGLPAPTVRFESIAPVVAPPITNEFVKADGGHLTLDGRRVVFFGFNLDVWALLAAKDDAGKKLVDEQLDNAVRGGFTAVRWHNFDLGSDTNIFHAGGRAKATDPTTRQLDPVAMKRFVYCWNACRARNLRIVLTFHHRRQLTPRDKPDWPCPTFDELFEKPFPPRPAGELYPWCFFDAGLERLQAEFMQQLLTWPNPETGKTLGADPTLLAVILENEHLLTKDRPYSYQSRPVLNTMWVDAQEQFQKREGLSKLNKVDLQRCTAWVETRHFQVLAAEAHHDTPALIIAGTYYGDAPWTSLVSLDAGGDAFDFHFYSKYRMGESNGFLSGLDALLGSSKRSRFAATAGAFNWSGGKGGKPVFCTEWGPVGQYKPLARDPDDERGQVLRAMVDAAIAADVDAPFLYSWGHSRLADDQWSKHTVYDFRDDAVFLRGARWEIARFHDLSLRPAAGEQKALPLTDERLYGVGVGTDYRLYGPYTDPELSQTPAGVSIRMERN